MVHKSILACVLSVSWALAFDHTNLWAQNDWQYPDPYFGILEIEKNHATAADRRYRSEISPAPNSTLNSKPRSEPIRSKTGRLRLRLRQPQR